MKLTIAAMTILLSGCASGPLPWAQGPQMSEPECTASCNAHYTQCPQIFANFPERGAVECPAAHRECLKRCEKRPTAAPATPAPVTSATPPVTSATPAPGSSSGPVPAAPAVPSRGASSKEARLRELKHLYDEGLVSDDVYKERQRAILSEP
jgi:hypothetical protein